MCSSDLVRYALEKESDIDDDIKEKMAREFEDSVVEVLISKVIAALEENDVKTFILAGGVSANKRLREELKNSLEERYADIEYVIPEQNLSTDNATMIALAAHTHIENNDIEEREIIAKGNLRIDA